LCIHPWRSNPTDYHGLVVTPTDEEGPLLGEDSHDSDDNEVAVLTITEDFKEAHIIDNGASTSGEPYRSSLDVETKVVEQQFTSAVFEEITIIEGSSHTEVNDDVVQDQQIQSSTVATTVVENTTTLPSTTSSSPSTGRGSGISLSKLTKRSSSSSNVNSTSSSTSSSPLLGRLGRFAKIIRTSETNSSIQSKDSKSESLKNIPEAAEQDVKQLDVQQQQQQQQQQQVSVTENSIVDLGDLKLTKETILSEGRFETAVISEEPVSLLVNTSLGSKPVTIPGQSPGTPTSWAQSPTLHQNDASINSSLAKVGRSSTIDSANENGTDEAGSVKSNELQSSSSVGKDSGIADLSKKRKNSVLKKIGKAIKSSKDKVDKRLSRQGSMPLESPIEVEEKN
ncbi:hypothetical protein BGZ76_006739, partial [Entomortierella beljakovae]